MHRSVSRMISNLGQFILFWEIVMWEGFAYPMVEFSRWLCSADCPAVSSLGCLVYFPVIASVQTLLGDKNFVSV